ncbi:hypothetical protein BS78_09G240100 [Paspalum vaginatum]|nr:hypothetical protein BS78_09G240100 [Paspalum vaginatum]
MDMDPARRAMLDSLSRRGLLRPPGSIVVNRTNIDQVRATPSTWTAYSEEKGRRMIFLKTRNKSVQRCYGVFEIQRYLLRI